MNRLIPIMFLSLLVIGGTAIVAGDTGDQKKDVVLIGEHDASEMHLHALTGQFNSVSVVDENETYDPGIVTATAIAQNTDGEMIGLGDLPKVDQIDSDVVKFDDDLTNLSIDLIQEGWGQGFIVVPSDETINVSIVGALDAQPVFVDDVSDAQRVNQSLDATDIEVVDSIDQNITNEFESVTRLSQSQLETRLENQVTDPRAQTNDPLVGAIYSSAGFHVNSTEDVDSYDQIGTEGLSASLSLDRLDSNTSVVAVAGTNTTNEETTVEVHNLDREIVEDVTIEAGDQVETISEISAMSSESITLSVDSETSVKVIDAQTSNLFSSVDVPLEDWAPTDALFNLITGVEEKINPFAIVGLLLVGLGAIGVVYWRWEPQ